MTRSRPLVALAAVLALAGCPGLPGLSSSPKLEPKILAITSSDQGITTAKVSLSWDGVSNAATYQVGRRVGDSTEKILAAIDKTSYDDNVQPKLTLTYLVHAVSAGGDEIVASSAKTIQVLEAQVGKPGGLMVDGASASATVSGRATSSKPSLSWSVATGATAYYVTVNEAKDGGGTGNLIYASLTKSPAATVGSLTLPDLKLPSYPQVQGSGLIKNKNYFVGVTAIRSDVAELANATAFDVADSDGQAVFSYL